MNNWQKVKIGDFAKNVNKKCKDNFELPVVSVTKYKGIVPSLEYFKKQIYSKDLSNYKVIKRNQFAYATIHLDEGSIGYLNLFDEALLSPMYTVFEVDESEIDIIYLYNLLKSNNLMKKYQRLGLGSVDRRKSIKFSDFANIIIELPPFKIQKKIAHILSSVDKAIEKTDQIIEKTVLLKKGLMQELLTKGIGHTKFKKTKLGEIPEGWDIIRLSDIIKELKAGVSVNSENRSIQEGEFGILKTSSVTYGIFDPSQHKKIIEEDIKRALINPKKDHIIFSRMNTPLLVGASAYVNKDYPNLYLPDRLWQFELIDNCSIVTIWLSNYLNWDPTRDRIRELATGTSASMKNISKEKLMSFEIVLPNTEEQLKIESILTVIEEKVSLNKKVKVKLLTLKKGLMQDIFNQKVEIN